MANGMAERVQSRLDRLEREPGAVAREAGIPPDALLRLLDGRTDAIRGRRLVRLADALATSVAYLVGLDPDDAVPAEWLEEDQAELGLLSIDEHALLRAYRRLDVSSRSALLHLLLRMSPEPETRPEFPGRRPRRP